MITHFKDIELQTLSIEGTKQIYADILQFPITKRTDTYIQFQVTSFTTISFTEVLESIIPNHFAFQVPTSSFEEVANWLMKSGVHILKDTEGETIIYHSPVSKAVYFKDNDGNILEIITRDYVNENVLPKCGPLQVMYVRELGFPVTHVPTFREWLKDKFYMKTIQDAETFNFVIGGTAHAVVVKEGRPWIPIGMRALSPNMKVTFGTPDLDFINELRQDKTAILIDDGVLFTQGTYTLEIEYTPEFSEIILSQLNLPLSQNTKV
ncbi:glyoxalase [Bacillus manliponensis]|uniref:Glyoxalase n=1 Tax=Bacillus manliponensis TaxID=574376 RepID=A0A073KBH5_9BACI|nr:glyoxalase [Bacillus manliponensis]KEK19653.1 glyoxalase [Bacillus manliponensis]